MHLRIRRRRFGQLAIASAATAAIANLAGKAVAQSDTKIIGASVASNNSTPQSASSAADSTPGITWAESSVTSSQVVSNSNFVAPTTVNNASTLTQTAAKATATQPNERLTGLTTQPNGTLVSTTVASAKDGNVTRLVLIDPTTSKVKNSFKVTGFPNNNSTVESVEALKNNSLLSVISLNEGTPPFDLATIDPTTGKVTPSAASGLPSLNSNRRYSNLAQAPDGTVYGTSLGREGVTTLVQIDLGNKSINTLVQLSYNNKPLADDLISLAFSSTGQPYALANPNHQATNSLYTVDLKTGVLTLVKQYDVEQIAFSHT